MIHTTEDWHNSSPLGRRVPRLTVPPGRGVGALESPQDRYGQDSQDGDLQSGTRKGGHGGARSSGGHGRWSSWPWPHPGHSSRNPSTPPSKISQGHLGGIRSPPGLDTETGTGHTQTRQSTEQDRLDRTTHRNRKPSLGELGSWGPYWPWRGVRDPHKVASGTASTSTKGGAGG